MLLPPGSSPEQEFQTVSFSVLHLYKQVMLTFPRCKLSPEVTKIGCNVRGCQADPQQQSLRPHRTPKKVLSHIKMCHKTTGLCCKSPGAQLQAAAEDCQHRERSPSEEHSTRRALHLQGTQWSVHMGCSFPADTQAPPSTFAKSPSKWRLSHLQDFGSLASDLDERICQALHQGAEKERQVGHNVQVWNASKHLHQHTAILSSSICDDTQDGFLMARKSCLSSRMRLCPAIDPIRQEQP